MVNYSVAGQQLYPITGYKGLLGASIDPADAQTPASVGGQVWPTRVRVPANTALTTLYCYCQTSGTFTAGTNQFGLYDDTGAQVATTPNDSTLWASTGWRSGTITGGPIAAQTTDRFVYIVPLISGFSGVQWLFASGANAAPATGPGGGNRRAMFSNASALPASFDPTSYGTAESFVALLGYG